MDLSGKRIVVIGGGGGMGREIALQTATQGATVVIGDIDLEAAETTAELCSQSGKPAQALRCDLGQDASVERFAHLAQEMLGDIDIVFNHAGVSLGGVLELTTSDDWNWMLNVNLVGLNRSIRAFVPRLTRNGGGWIVNTSSGLGLFQDVPMAAPYSASKAAIIAYSRALAVYLKNRNIGVTVFCPDLTRTDFLKSGRLAGIPAGLAAGALAGAVMQDPAGPVRELIEGLLREEFLVSSVPRTPERLATLANGMLALGADSGQRRDARFPIIQRAEVTIPPEAVEAALEEFERFATVSRNHWGCRDYHFARSASRPGVIEIFEVFDSQTALNAHACAPETLEFLQKMSGLGLQDFKIRQI